MSLLKVERLRKHFGGLAALNDVSFDVQERTRLAIIGPNGAGKSTLFNIIAGELPPSSGAIAFKGADVTHLPVHARSNLGIGHTFQRNNLFFGLTPRQSVGLALQHRLGIAGRWFMPAAEQQRLDGETELLLEQVGLAAGRDQRVSTLSYGQQRALEVALALATRPQLLLLDEPTAGMSPSETREIIRLIVSQPRSLSILIVEHDMDVVFAIAERIIVLHYGQIIADGEPDQIKNDSAVKEAYLGT
jgi:branched-chain amino acid transport system ATP-binding protein